MATRILQLGGEYINVTDRQLETKSSGGTIAEVTKISSGTINTVSNVAKVSSGTIDTISNVAKVSSGTIDTISNVAKVSARERLTRYRR